MEASSFGALRVLFRSDSKLGLFGQCIEPAAGRSLVPLFNPGRGGGKATAPARSWLSRARLLSPQLQA